MIRISVCRKITRGKPSPTWYLRYQDPDTGKRVWRSTGFTRKDLAQRAANDLARDLEAGEAGVRAPPAFSEAVEEFLEARKARNRPLTVSTYRSDLRYFLEVSETRKISDISQRVIERFIGKISDSKKTASINKYLRTLKTFLRWAKSVGYIRSVPKIEMIREDLQVPVKISREDQKKILRVIETFPCRLRSREWWSTIVRLLFYTGMRRGEILALKWEDIDLEGRTLHKRAESSKSRTSLLIPLSDPMVRILGSWREVGQSEDLVFPVRQKSVRQVWDEWWAITEAAVGRRVAWKDCRSTAASELAETQPLGVVQRWLGHSTPLVTTKYYVNNDEAIRRAGDSREVL